VHADLQQYRRIDDVEGVVVGVDEVLLQIDETDRDDDDDPERVLAFCCACGRECQSDSQDTTGEGAHDDRLEVQCHAETPYQLHGQTH